MGSGKTTIGRLVAGELGLEFRDCDHELEEITGASVNLIFDVEGEQGFRERERQVLARLAQEKGVLVATGGGVVKQIENRMVLRRSGLVVWLKTSVDQQMSRLSQDKSRPLLQTRNRFSRLHKLAGERDPLYQEIADLEFVSPNRSSKVAARALCQLIINHRRNAVAGEPHAQR
jgi:shikimate kinase